MAAAKQVDDTSMLLDSVVKQFEKNEASIINQLYNLHFNQTQDTEQDKSPKRIIMSKPRLKVQQSPKALDSINSSRQDFQSEGNVRLKQKRTSRSAPPDDEASFIADMDYIGTDDINEISD